MKEIRHIILLILITSILTSCNGINQREVNLEIATKPLTLELGRGKLKTLPSYDKFQPGKLQIDLRSYDLTTLDLKERYEDLIHADFDTVTKWPYGLPEGFNPKKIIEQGKNPGLNIRDLHNKGITGEGVGIAIIDGALLVNHVEYRDRLKLYEEVHCLDKTSTPSGCAVVSVIAGEKTGVAPKANIYYIAETHKFLTQRTSDIDFSSLALAVKRILEINDTLPKRDKIRALVIDGDWTQTNNDHDAMDKAVEEAKEKGIFVVSNSICETYNQEMDFNGLGRDPLADPDDISSYGPGEEWKSRFFMFEKYSNAKEVLLVPMDSRTTASPTGDSDYTFYNVGDIKLSSAYIAGLYALACQVKPEITPQEFWHTALKTGDTTYIINNVINYNYKFGKVVNPKKLIKELMK
ncbi:peptidase S8 [Ruminiclostridium herbifermentans]|nr:peptidase S8 [Ruminiclostridium herbifermentans]